MKLAVALALAGCGGPHFFHSNDADADSDSDSDSDTDTGSDWVSGEHGCSALYDEDLFPTFEIEIADAEWTQIQAEFADPASREAVGLDAKPYHPLEAFRYGDEVVTDAQIRLKGNQYFSWIPPKMQFVISFNETDPDARFHDLRKISLDSPWYDPSLLHERLALFYLRDIGQSAQCANSARLFVNDAYYGVYTNQEKIDHEFLERVFGDENADGNLYKYGRDLKTNEDVADTSRRDQFWAAGDIATMEGLGEVEQWVSEWAAEAMIPDGDGYWCCSHNFYTYDHPTRGFLFVPSDLDYTFDGGDKFVTISPELSPLDHSWGVPQHFGVIEADATWRPRFTDAVEAARDGYHPDALLEKVDAWAAQIESAVDEDPNKTFTFDDHLRNVDLLRAYLEPRAAYVDDWIACDRGVGGTDADGDGVAWCIECDDANDAVFPGAPEICNGLDDDCDSAIDRTDACCTDVEIRGVHYGICNWPRTWDDASAFCASIGATLGAPPDVDANTDLFWAALGYSWEDFWIGATDATVEGTFTDPAGAPLAWEGWAAGTPDGADAEDCAVLDVWLGGAWNDRSCGEVHPSICRMP